MVNFDKFQTCMEEKMGHVMDITTDKLIDAFERKLASFLAQMEINNQNS